MNSPIQPPLLRRLFVPLIFWIGIILPVAPVQSQQMPPRPVSISKWQDLNFGTFCCGTTGSTVTVTSDGLRSYSGDIVLIASSLLSAAKFDVDAVATTMIHVLNGPDVEMLGPNGGKMILTLGDSDPLSPFSASFTTSTISIGGTLTVVSETLPAGNYSCTFDITFIQE